MQYNMTSCDSVTVKWASGLYTLSANKNEKLTDPWNGRTTPQKNNNKKKKKHKKWS